MERTTAADLGQFIQRRELLGYEQKMARVAYAYGVDLRRSQWLDESSLGEPILRGVDRRWTRLVNELERDVVDPTHAAPLELMESLLAVTRLLRASRPALRVLRPQLSGKWPIATPLGTTKGSVQWLLVDAERYLGLNENERLYHLAAAVAHLQCDHGPLFAAHLAAEHSPTAAHLVRLLLGPWTRVAPFSADRAGLLAAGALAPALAAMHREAQDALQIPWSPRFPEASVRERALRDFDRSAVVARLRLLSGGSGDPVTTADHAKADETRSAAARPPDRVDDLAAEPIAEELTAEQVAERTLRNAWSLARCDERLTRRLGLL